ncbi:MAG: peptidylprolyl isomerase [Drouetiella hepatica Uher 2000/2452]|uniref:peptidylprolyl isomerase n=1 Tax=Drouetiella hepatica Uher 2000/2452 TaxID=904376 RepID=A0A951Q9K0_9CYAN|nr:peptidylprolyl isomerase [Drouetiella hepatica Uher 2000/2452]
MQRVSFQETCQTILRSVARVSVVTVVAIALAIGFNLTTGFMATGLNRGTAIALPPGNAVTDGKALLRNALPIENKPVRELQRTFETMSDALRARRISGLTRNLATANRVLTVKKAALLAGVPADRQPQAEALIAEMKADVENMRADVEAQDKAAIQVKRSHILDKVGLLEDLMVDRFPYEVPAEYSNLPQLKGRATIEMETTQGKVTLVVDGYNAPVTAGNFVDLVQRGFYDGLSFTRAEDFYVLQIGDPPGKEDGFIDPDTGKYRAVPLEVMVKGDSQPTYGITLEDAGRYLDQPVLPFSAYGTLSMARPETEPNGGSSQFFFFLFEPELTPAGLNLLDGRYSVFGYVTENKEVLREIKQGDKVISAKVIKGLENLVEPQQSI